MPISWMKRTGQKGIRATSQGHRMACDSLSLVGAVLWAEVAQY